MTHDSYAQLINGDLYIIFNEADENNISSIYKLDNGAELEFDDDKLLALMLPNFEEQLGRGPLIGLEIEVDNIVLNDIDMVLSFSLKIHGQVVNGRIDCSSLK